MEYLPFFPTPRPNELFYSILARFHFTGWNHLNIPAWTFEDLFSGETTSISIDYPSHLNMLCSKFSKGSLLRPELFIHNHSVFPMFKPFITSEDADRVVEFMKGKNARAIGMILGESQSKIDNPRCLRFCIECLHEDITNFGEAYWHREHQLFGVFVCPVHKQVLMETDFEVRTTYALRNFYDLNESAVNNSTSVLCNLDMIDHFDNVAQSIYCLLNNSYPSIGAEQLKERYLYYLKEKNLATFNGRVKEQDLLNGLVTFYGSEFLEIMNSRLNPDNRNNWTKNLFRPKKVHPLRHVLIINFLGLTIDDFLSNPIEETKPFGDGPWVCFNAASNHYQQPVIMEYNIKRSSNGKITGTFSCNCGFSYSRIGPDTSPLDQNRIGTVQRYGELWEQELLRLKNKENYTIRAIAATLKVTPLTVLRKLKMLAEEESDFPAKKCKEVEDITVLAKRKWTSLILANSRLTRTELRLLAKREYMWLYRHERKWLNEHSPKAVKKFSSNNTNRTKKDEDILSSKILLMSDELKKEKTPVRITKTLIGRKLRINIKTAIKMPKVKKALDDVVETVEEFQVRRVEFVTSQLFIKGEQLSISKVMKAASIQKNKVSTYVLEKINEIVECNRYIN